jgi:hypothetical protein
MKEAKKKYLSMAHHGYPMSRDYPRLLELIEEGRIFAIVDCYETCRDPVFVRKGGSFGYDIGVRGFGYADASTPDEFLAECERLNLEFLDPATFSKSV